MYGPIDPDLAKNLYPNSTKLDPLVRVSETSSRDIVSLRIIKEKKYGAGTDINLALAEGSFYITMFQYSSEETALAVYKSFRVRTFKCLWGPGIDSKE